MSVFDQSLQANLAPPDPRCNHYRAEFLDEVKDFDGVTGKISFDNIHDIVRAGTEGVYILEVKNGKCVVVN